MIYFIYWHGGLSILMKKFKANFFLVLILWVQFGSTGFTYYVNSCNFSGITSISLNYIGCRCSVSTLTLENHNEWEHQMTKKCCSSIEHFVDTGDDYPNSAFQLQDFQVEDLFIGSPIVKVKENHIYNCGVENYNCNSPPERNIDIRIFIHSFVI